MQQYILDIIYIIGALSFIFGIKLLGKPESAKRGNFIAALGMCIAVFGTIFLYHGENDLHLKNLPWIFGGLIIGSVIGTMMALETLKLILGLPVLTNQLLIVETLSWNIRKLHF